MSSAVHHRHDVPVVTVAAVTVSDTRTPETDAGGDRLVELVEAAGHTVGGRQIVPDDPERIGRALGYYCSDAAIAAILLTGGTGIAERDQTYETVTSLLTKELPGYGELLRMLSYKQVGAKAMLSRAIAGVIGTTLVFTMPGSPKAVELAMEKLILPELGHLVREATR